MLTRVRSDRSKADFENYGLEHVLSYQRRISATKERFMKRNHKTPFGIIRDYWDRTEAQMRAALHAHILTFFKSRETQADFKPLPALERIVSGHEPKQRPRDSSVPPLDEWQADNVYQTHHVGPIVAEMVRPNVKWTKLGRLRRRKVGNCGAGAGNSTKVVVLPPITPVLPQGQDGV